MTKELTTPEPAEMDTRLQRLIWRGLGSKTVREIAEEAGVSVEDVMRVKRGMLDSIDSLTIQERQAKLIADLSEVAEIALDRARAIGGDAESLRNLGPVLTSAVQAQKTVLNEMRQISKETNGQVEKLNQRRIDGLILLVRTTVDNSVAELAQKYDISTTEMFEVFNRNMLAAAQELEASEGT